MSPVIDGKGLFTGRRIRQCSDGARLRFPYYLLASNGLARIELDFSLIRSACFMDFRRPPKDAVIMSDFREYQEFGLCVLYQGDTTSQWAQFDCPDRCRPRHLTASDKRSPEPPENKRVPKFSENRGKFPVVGVGVEERKKPPPSEGEKKDQPERETYGEFGQCELSEDELRKLGQTIGTEEAWEYIQRFDSWVYEAPGAKSSGVARNKRKAYPTILNWWRRDKNRPRASVVQKVAGGFKVMEI